MNILLCQPAFDGASDATQLGSTAVNAKAAVSRLADADILIPIPNGWRNRIWLANDVVRVVDKFAARAKGRRHGNGKWDVEGFF